MQCMVVFASGLLMGAAACSVSAASGAYNEPAGLLGLVVGFAVGTFLTAIARDER